jgi:hypothetical protein
MRWRGPPDLAAPDTAISCSASKPLDQPPSRTPARSPSCPVPLASGVPPGWSPFSVVRAFLRPSSGAAQEVVTSNFKIFWPSTNCPQFGGSYPPASPDSPQAVHRWTLDAPDRVFSAGPHVRDRPCGREFGRPDKRSAGPRARTRLGRKEAGRAPRRPAGWQQLNRAMRTGAAGPGWRSVSRQRTGRAARHQVGRREEGRPASRRSAGLRAPAWPGGNETARPSREFAGPCVQTRLCPDGGRPVRLQISRTMRKLGQAARRSEDLAAGQAGRVHKLGQAARRSEDLAAGQAGRVHKLGQAARRLDLAAGQAGRVHELGRATGRPEDQPGSCGPGPQWDHIARSHATGRTRTGRCRPREPSRTKEEAPPRMRWRGPSDPAVPDTAISCSVSVPLDQPPSRIPARSPSCPVPLASGVPPGWFRFRQ